MWLWLTGAKDGLIKIHSDNMAVVQILNCMRTNEFLGVCIRNVLMQAAKYNIHICSQHIAGEENVVADALSRLGHGGRSFEWVSERVGIEKIPGEAFLLDFSL